MVTLSWRARSIMICQKPSRATGSTPEVGSSRISISGPWIIATASDSRWRSPSGSASGSASMTSVEAEALAPSPPPARRSVLAGMLNSRACRSRFCRTVSSV